MARIELGRIGLRMMPPFPSRPLKLLRLKAQLSGRLRKEEHTATREWPVRKARTAPQRISRTIEGATWRCDRRNISNLSSPLSYSCSYLHRYASLITLDPLDSKHVWEYPEVGATGNRRGPDLNVTDDLFDCQHSDKVMAGDFRTRGSAGRSWIKSRIRVGRGHRRAVHSTRRSCLKFAAATFRHWHVATRRW